MRAFTVSEFGPPSVLTPTELPVPVAGPGELVVEVTGAGVGPWDVKFRSGHLGPRDFPYVPGAEVSGLVSELGDGVTGFGVGDAIVGSPGFTGGYAEYTVVDSKLAAPVPSGVDLERAGGVPVVATTALEGLHDHLHLQAGETLLVSGAAGGVGHMVVQIAVAEGARVVATASPANHQFLHELGAERVLDYHEDWVPAVTGVDTAFDCVGGATWSGCVAALRPGGRAVGIVGQPGPEGREDVTVSHLSSTASSERLREAMGLIASGRVHLEVDALLPLDEAARAHELIESGHTRGKIILLPG